MSKSCNTFSLIEVVPSPSPVLRVGGSFERESLPFFSTPFSRGIMEASRPKKVKMPPIEPFDETMDPDNQLNVYKAQMYV